MRIAGFTLAANAARLDFPLVEAIRSILPLCDEVVVNLGPPEDGTRERLAALAEPRIRVIGGEWNSALGGAMLAVETQRALDACRADWAIYIQADEVLHEDSLPAFRSALMAAGADPAVEGLLVEFRHFYGGPDHVGRGRGWYRREVRALRTGIGIRSYQEAQGFRVGPPERRLQARRSGAIYHHYGWARPMAALRAKRDADNALYYGGAPRRRAPGDRLPWDVGLTRYRGTHPAVMERWIAERRGRTSEGFAPLAWSFRRLALHASWALERVTGWRPFEFRNYVEV